MRLDNNYTVCMLLYAVHYSNIIILYVCYYNYDVHYSNNSWTVVLCMLLYYAVHYSSIIGVCLCIKTMHSNTFLII